MRVPRFERGPQPDPSGDFRPAARADRGQRLRLPAPDHPPRILEEHVEETTTPPQAPSRFALLLLRRRRSSKMPSLGPWCFHADAITPLPLPLLTDLTFKEVVS